jgi:hypothetical protein
MNRWSQLTLTRRGSAGVESADAGRFDDQRRVDEPVIGQGPADLVNAPVVGLGSGPEPVDGGQARPGPQLQFLTISVDATQQVPGGATVIGGPSGPRSVGTRWTPQLEVVTDMATTVGQNNSHEEKELLMQVPLNQTARLLDQW